MALTYTSFRLESSSLDCPCYDGDRGSHSQLTDYTKQRTVGCHDLALELESLT